MNYMQSSNAQVKSVLDDEQLMTRLLSQAKPSHSAIGRAADVTLSFMTLPRTRKDESKRTDNSNKYSGLISENNNSNNTLVARPVVTGINKQAREIELHKEQLRQRTWAFADAQNALQIAELNTLPPSFTAAAAAEGNNNSNYTKKKSYRNDSKNASGMEVNKLQNAGYATLIGLCPTSVNINQIDDKDELISSFRAYRVDALRAKRDEALRSLAAPHPDWLHSMDPLANELNVQHLADLATLPIASTSNINTIDNTNANNDTDNEHQEEQEFNENGIVLGDDDDNNDASTLLTNKLETNTKERNKVETDSHDLYDTEKHTHAKEINGTYSFVCQGREELERARNGYANNKSKEHRCCYYPRYTITQPRIIGGYVAPPDSKLPSSESVNKQISEYGSKNNNGSSNPMTVQNVQALQSAHSQNMGNEEEKSNYHNNYNNGNEYRLCNGTNFSPGSQNERDDTSVRPSTGGYEQSNEARSVTENNEGYDQGQYSNNNNNTNHNHEYMLQEMPIKHKPGENVKGSSMFVSTTPRDTYQMESKDAQLDVMYWPYPDVRSNVHRTRQPVRFSHSMQTCRREPPIAGVPAAVYNVSRDIGSDVHHTVMMQTMTTRDSHWYGKNGINGNVLGHNLNASNGMSGGEGPMSSEEIDRALAMTRPHVKATTLPPRIQSKDNTLADNDYKHRKELKNAINKTCVSVEANLNFPPSTIGTPSSMQHAPSFEHMRGHNTAQQSKNNLKKMNSLRSNGLNYKSHLVGTQCTQKDVPDREYNVRRTLIDKKIHSSIIHPTAPGHAPLHNAGGAGLHTELGNIPNLKWVKPNVSRTTSFGACNTRPSHLLPLHDLSYDTEKCYHVIDPNVKGDPMIGLHLTRDQRASVAAINHCGADVQYDVPLPTQILSSTAPSSTSFSAYVVQDKPKLIPMFDKQITKETQFCGHRIPSERWERANPKAPGPGSYNVSYNQIEKVLESLLRR